MAKAWGHYTTTSSNVAGHSVEQDRQPTREGHKLDSYLLNTPLVPWAMGERPGLAPGRPPTALGSDHGPVVLGIPPAVAAKERITCLASSHAQGKLHTIRSDSPGVPEAAAAMLQRACDDPTLLGWLSSDRDEATMGTPAVQAVFDLLYPSVMRCRGSQGCACPQAWPPSTPMGRRTLRRVCPRSLRINRPSDGMLGSCGEEMRMKQDLPPGRLPPSCSTSGAWTRTYPPTPWRTCGKRPITNFSSSTNAWNSSAESSGATDAGPSRTIGGAWTQIYSFGGRRFEGPSTLSAMLPWAYGWCESRSQIWSPRKSLGKSKGNGRCCMPSGR